VSTPAVPAKRFGPGAVATPANFITIARLLLAIPTLILIERQGTSWLTVSLWFVLSCTDGVDGWIARRDGTTRSGAFLDPLADKFLVLVAMITLIDRHVFWWLPVAIIFARELTMSLYRVFVGTRGISVPASKIAKWKTIAQQFAVAFAIAPLTAVDATWLWKGTLWLAVALTLISFCQYMWRAHRHNADARTSNAS
jgi:CDP-diacylglycerol--glycerol-3-phosphate 3-phosphatidyltransferase